MKQAKWMLGFLLLAGLVVAGFLILNRGEVAAPGESTTKKETVTETEPESSEPDSSDEAPIQTAGKYVSYSESQLTDASLGTKVLFFYAPWCPQCRQLETSIQAGEIPAGVTVIKVDYDSNQSLRARYGVTIQTTLVRIDDDGDLVKKYVAYDEPSLKSLVENLL